MTAPAAGDLPALLGALVAAAALTATSVGISARVLGELGVLERPEGRVVLGAAVLDDIIGLVILSVVSSTVAGAAMTGWGIARTALVAIGFVVLAVALGTRVAPPVFRFVARVEMEGVLGPIASPSRCSSPGSPPRQDRRRSSAPSPRGWCCTTPPSAARSSRR